MSISSWNTAPVNLQEGGSPAESVYPSVERFRFTGSGSEYFRIWIINLLLTIATFGIYSAWAKVRKARYLYENTTVAGAAFEYHGSPIAILKGRIIAVVLLAAYHFLASGSGTFGLLALLAIGALLPWLLWKSLRFSRLNSSYRGIRFGFGGTTAHAYKVFLFYPLGAMMTAYLLAPLAHHRIKRFQLSESRFGNQAFHFGGKAIDFYKLYGTGLVFSFAGALAAAFLFAGVSSLLNVAGFRPGIASAVLFALTVYAGAAVLFQAVTTMVQNLVWNNTSLGPHRFESTLRWRSIAWIAATNLAGVIVTMGLYLPFATIRMVSYRVESMTLLANGSLDEFIARREGDVSATGEGVADLLDFDVSL